MPPLFVCTTPNSLIPAAPATATTGLSLLQHSFTLLPSNIRPFSLFYTPAFYHQAFFTLLHSCLLPSGLFLLQHSFTLLPFTIRPFLLQHSFTLLPSTLQTLFYTPAFSHQAFFYSNTLLHSCLLTSGLFTLLHSCLLPSDLFTLLHSCLLPSDLFTLLHSSLLPSGLFYSNTICHLCHQCISV